MPAAQRWLAVGCFEHFANDLHAIQRTAAGREPEPTTAVQTSRTLQSTSESGQRTAYDGRKRKNGSKLHLAMDTLSDLLALHVTLASVGDLMQVGRLAKAMHIAAGDRVDLACVNQGYSCDRPVGATEKQGIRAEMVKLPEAKRGFVMRMRRKVVERSLAWTTCFRHLARDDKGYSSAFIGLHLVALVCLMLKNVPLLAPNSQCAPTMLKRLDAPFCYP